jgi:hypothetical protein
MSRSVSSEARNQPADAGKRPAGESSPPPLDPDSFRSSCVEYLRKHAQAGILAKRLKKLNPIIKAELDRGQKSPSELPYLLELQPGESTDRDYRTPLLNALTKIHGSEEKAEAELKAIEDGFEKTPTKSLVVKINPAFATKKLPKLA